MIDFATQADATPVLIVIPQNDEDYTVLEGDIHEGYEDTEVEYLIPDLKPESNFKSYLLSCSDLDDKTKWHWLNS